MSIISKIVHKIRIKAHMSYLIRNKNVIFDAHSITDFKTKFEGCNLLGKNSALFESSIGYASYIGDWTNLINVQIGKYTCIGPRVINIIGRHPTKDFISIHPAFYSINKQVGFTYVKHKKFQEFIYANSKDRISVVIGNDVWIASDVRILEGITIGDGAIIAAGSLINKDVPAYAIVGGVPAKVIRYRFESENIKYLKELKWWNKEDDWIKKHSNYFTNIVDFKQSQK